MRRSVAQLECPAEAAPDLRPASRLDLGRKPDYLTRQSPSGPLDRTSAAFFPKQALFVGLILESGERVGMGDCCSQLHFRPMAKSPFKFLQEVRAETEKVTWPSRRETAITTAMVFVMVGIASIFFLIADQIIRLVVTTILGIGS